MKWRKFFGSLFASGAGLLALGAAAKGASASKVAYHLSDLDKARFVLGNISNHIAGCGGPGGITVALVVHGPALRAFHAIDADADVEKSLARLKGDGVDPIACAITMKAQKVALSDLLPGFAVAEKGAVVRLGELQQQGYVYLRP
ncbi:MULTISPECIES: DsrE family protein [Methylosinus]|uniref:Uncharacterized protein n=1 Tax=Methylosinus trichosporium (strain ATCC 35070 / NCIMB 11131 / UNIQEM 75 / OB3b) TaxID=595536 RepID=A0A2D2D6E5_METT3|nr:MULTISPECIES: DsrE family protein [Methylosinus]ATQ70591.1 hypothetical protein CQW49_21575 [Methylosinus trichosporium OB3b]OBS51053.1 hypothetical protein A8B73_18215 [Methylosinus sp. 3S-1]